ncbi:hypothetical protein EVAR_60830_1 [Eumeta japonica]|uniref:Uncharacterized protein n=1 Tax=Eumeta variegata TaxID=151549 RepID=A0A4C1ZVB5_EUMVA|nr:hypothetical protein EVAR_60830_1 [Eumeta japonica]
MGGIASLAKIYDIALFSLKKPTLGSFRSGALTLLYVFRSILIHEEEEYKYSGRGGRGRRGRRGPPSARPELATPARKRLVARWCRDREPPSGRGSRMTPDITLGRSYPVAVASAFNSTKLASGATVSKRREAAL